MGSISPQQKFNLRSLSIRVILVISNAFANGDLGAARRANPGCSREGKYGKKWLVHRRRNVSKGKLGYNLKSIEYRLELKRSVYLSYGDH